MRAASPWCRRRSITAAATATRPIRSSGWTRSSPPATAAGSTTSRSTGTRCTGDALAFVLGRFDAYARPVWLTEFSCLDVADISEPVQQQYMRDALPTLEADSNVFPVLVVHRPVDTAGNPDTLPADPGQLTALGETYVSLDGACR